MFVCFQVAVFRWSRRDQEDEVEVEVASNVRDTVEGRDEITSGLKVYI